MALLDAGKGWMTGSPQAQPQWLGPEQLEWGQGWVMGLAGWWQAMRQVPRVLRHRKVPLLRRSGSCTRAGC